MKALRAEPGTSPARRAAEERWHARVRAAKLRFDLALAQLEQALQEPGAASAVRAHEIEREARHEYQRELQTFTDLIVRGKMPED